MSIEFECNLAAAPIPLGAGAARRCRRTVSALLSRIDEDHANPRRAWQEMGEPDYPSPRQVKTLHAASALRPQAHPLRVAEGRIEFELVMPPQSVAALKIERARL